MKKSTNTIFRNYLDSKNLTQYEVAAILGISENTMYRRLRFELPRETQEAMIQEIEAKKGSAAND